MCQGASGMGKQCEGCIYYKSLGACGEGTEKACHYLLICGKPRVRDGEKCRSRQEEKVRRKKNGEIGRASCRERV